MLTCEGRLSGHGVVHKTWPTGNKQNRGIWDQLKTVFQKRAPRAPRTAKGSPQGLSLLQLLNAEARPGVPQYIELRSTDVIAKLGLPKQKNVLGMKRSVEYRAILDVLNHYHEIKFNTDSQSRQPLTTVLKDLISTCQQYREVKNRRPDPEKVIDQVLDQAQKALASILVQSETQTHHPPNRLEAWGRGPAPRDVANQLDVQGVRLNRWVDGPVLGPRNMDELRKILDGIADNIDDHVRRGALDQGRSILDLIGSVLVRLGAIDQALPLLGRSIDILVKLNKTAQARQIVALIDERRGRLTDAAKQALANDFGRLGDTDDLYLWHHIVDLLVKIDKKDEALNILAAKVLAQSDGRGDADGRKAARDLIGKIHSTSTRNLDRHGRTNEALLNQLAVRELRLQRWVDGPVSGPRRMEALREILGDIAGNLDHLDRLDAIDQALMGGRDRTLTDRIAANLVRLGKIDAARPLLAESVHLLVKLGKFDQADTIKAMIAAHRDRPAEKPGTADDESLNIFDSPLDAPLSKEPECTPCSQRPEACPETAINLPWFAADGSLGAGYVDTGSEAFTADHLDRVHGALTLSTFSRELCREVRDHLQKNLLFSPGQPESGNITQDQADRWEFLLRNGTSFYSEHEKATVRIAFEAGAFQHLKPSEDQTDAQESRTRYGDIRAGGEVVQSRETKRHLGPSMFCLVPLPGAEVAAATAGAAELSISKKETLTQGTYHHVQGDCKPIAGQLHLFCGHAKMVVHLDGGKPRRFELTLPNQLRLQIPKGTCEAPASPMAPQMKIRRPEAIYTVSCAVHAFPIQRLIDGLRLHLAAHGLSMRAVEKLLHDARKDFFNEKNFIARSQYLFTASLVSPYFKVNTGVLSQFETFFQAGAELDKVQLVGISPNDKSAMSTFRDDIGEGVLIHQKQDKADGIDFSLGVSATTPKFGPNIRVAAGPMVTLFGTKKKYSQKIMTRSLAKEAVVRTDALCLYKALTSVTVKIHSNLKRHVPPFRSRIPIEIAIPGVQRHDFECHALDRQHPAQIDHPMQIKLSSSQLEGSDGKAIKDCLHFGYSNQMPGAEKIFQTIQKVLREDNLLDKMDIRQQSNLFRVLQTKFSVPALRARHQNLLQGCRIVHEFPVGRHHYRIELGARYRLPDRFRKLTGMSAYRFNRGILETGNAESKSKYWGINFEAGALAALNKNATSTMPGGGAKWALSRSREQEHAIVSGNWEHRCLKTSGEVLRFDCPTTYMLIIDVNDARGTIATARQTRGIDGETSIYLPIELYPRFEQGQGYPDRTTALQESSEQEFNAPQDELKLRDHGINATAVAMYGTAELATAVSRLVKRHTSGDAHQTSDIKIPEEISNIVNPGYLQSKIGNLIGPGRVVVPLTSLGGYERSVTLRVKTCAPTYIGGVASDTLALEQYTQSYAGFSNTKTTTVSHVCQADLNLGVKIPFNDDAGLKIRAQQAGKARSYAKKRYTHIGLDANVEYGRSKDDSHAMNLGSMNLSMAIGQGSAQRFCADTIYEIAFHVFRPEINDPFGGLLPPLQEAFVEYWKIKHGLELLMPNPLARKYHLPIPSTSALDQDEPAARGRQRDYIQPELALHCSHVEHLDAEQVLPKITALLRQRCLQSGIHPDIAAGNTLVMPKRILDESFCSDALRLAFGQLRSTGIYKQVFYPQGGRKSLKMIGVRVTASLGTPEYRGPRDIGISVGSKSFEVFENSEARTSSLSGTLGLHGGINTTKGTHLGFAGQAGLESYDKTENRTQTTFRNHRRLDTRKAEAFSHPVEYRIELWDDDIKSELTRRMRKMMPSSPAPAKPKEPFASATVQGRLHILVPTALTGTRLPIRLTEPMVTGRIIPESASLSQTENDLKRRRMLSKNLHALNFPGASTVARWAAAAFSQAPPLSARDPAGDVPPLPSRFELPKSDGAKLNQAFNVENLRSNIGLLLNHRYAIHLQGEDKLTVGLEVTQARWLARDKIRSRNQSRQVLEPETKTEKTRRKFKSSAWHGGAFLDVMTPYLESGSVCTTEVSQAQSAIDKDLDEKVLAYNRIYEFGEMDIRFHVHGSNGRCVLIDVINGMTAAIMSNAAENLADQFPEICSRTPLPSIAEEDPSMETD